MANNRELYDYLVRLRDRLNSLGANALAESVATAIGNAASLSTEFLGESRIALSQVQIQAIELLNVQECEQLNDVLNQINAAFDHR